MNVIKPGSAAEVSEAVQSSKRLRPLGGGTKPALSTACEGCTCLDLSGLSGILEYDPGEYTFTALAGTPLALVEEALREHGQYLPFDPPLSRSGATLGGTVAAGLSGPGRYRYGGVRDFLVGAGFVDGDGRELRGGGKVVKNAAGFDFPKLLTGSLGELGVLTDLTFKVFPRKEAFATLSVETAGLSESLAAISVLNNSSEELFALELEPPGKLVMRVGGCEPVIPGLLERLRSLLKSPGLVLEEEEAHWGQVAEFNWVAGEAALIKAPATLSIIEKIDGRLEEFGAGRRYGCGGNVAWISWPAGEPLEPLERILSGAGTRGLILRAPGASFSSPVLNRLPGAFEDRIRSVLDAPGTFSLRELEREG